MYQNISQLFDDFEKITYREAKDHNIGEQWKAYLQEVRQNEIKLYERNFNTTQAYLKQVAEQERVAKVLRTVGGVVGSPFMWAYRAGRGVVKGLVNIVHGVAQLVMSMADRYVRYGNSVIDEFKKGDIASGVFDILGADARFNIEVVLKAGGAMLGGIGKFALSTMGNAAGMFYQMGIINKDQLQQATSGINDLIQEVNDTEKSFFAITEDPFKMLGEEANKSDASYVKARDEQLKMTDFWGNAMDKTGRAFAKADNFISNNFGVGHTDNEILNGKFNNFANGVAESIGRMIPSAVAAYFTGGMAGAVVGNSLLFAENFGGNISDAQNRVMQAEDKAEKIREKMNELERQKAEMGTLEFAEKFEQLDNEYKNVKPNATIEDRIRYAFSGAMSETLIESLGGFKPSSFANKQLSGGLYKSMKKEVIKNVLEEGFEEILGGLNKQASESWLGNVGDTTYENSLSDLAMDFASGAVSGGVFSGGVNIVHNQTQKGRIENSTREFHNLMMSSDPETRVRQLVHAQKTINNSIDNFNKIPFMTRVAQKMNPENAVNLATESMVKKADWIKSMGLDGMIGQDPNTGEFKLTELGNTIVNNFEGYMAGTQGGKTLDVSKYAISAHRDGGIVHDDNIQFATRESIENEPDLTKQKVMKHILKHHSNVAFVDGNTANMTNLSSGMTYLNRNMSVNEMIRQVGPHEYTHRMKVVNPETYARLGQMADNMKLSDNQTVRLKDYTEKYTAKYGQQLGAEYARDERIAMLVENIAKNPKVVNKMISDPKLRREFLHTIEKIAEKDNAVLKRYGNAFAKSLKNAIHAQKGFGVVDTTIDAGASVDSLEMATGNNTENTQGNSKQNAEENKTKEKSTLESLLSDKNEQTNINAKENNNDSDKGKENDNKGKEQNKQANDEFRQQMWYLTMNNKNRLKELKNTIKNKKSGAVELDGEKIIDTDTAMETATVEFVEKLNKIMAKTVSTQSNMNVPYNHIANNLFTEVQNIVLDEKVRQKSLNELRNGILDTLHDTFGDLDSFVKDDIASQIEGNTKGSLWYTKNINALRQLVDELRATGEDGQFEILDKYIKSSITAQEKKQAIKPIEETAKLLKEVFDEIEKIKELGITETTSKSTVWRRFQQHTATPQISMFAKVWKSTDSASRKQALRQRIHEQESINAIYGTPIRSKDGKMIRGRLDKDGNAIKPYISKMFDSLSGTRLDPYAMGQLWSLGLEHNLGNAVVKEFDRAQIKLLEVDNKAYEIWNKHAKAWDKVNKKTKKNFQTNCYNLDKENITVSGLHEIVSNGGQYNATITMSQAMSLYLAMRREMVRNYMIDKEFRGGEKSTYFDAVKETLGENDKKGEATSKTFYVEGVRKNKGFKKTERRQLKIEKGGMLKVYKSLEQQIKKHEFAQAYMDALNEYLGEMYKYNNIACEHMNGTHLANDNFVLERMSEEDIKKMNKATGLSLTANDRIYFPFYSLTSGTSDATISSGAFSTKNIIDLGVPDGMIQEIKLNKGQALVKSINDVVHEVVRGTKNLYAMGRLGRDLNLLFAETSADMAKNGTEQRGQLEDLVNSMHGSIIKYFEKLYNDMCGFSTKNYDESSRKVNKFLGTMKRNFYASVLGLNLKVIATQYASFFTLGTVFQDKTNMKNKSLLLTMGKNLLNIKALKEKCKPFLEDSEIFKDRIRNGSFELGEAKTENIVKTKFEKFKEITMKGINLADAHICMSMYGALLDLGYTHENAMKLTEEGILRYQSSSLQSTRTGLLRTENNLTKMFLKFLGEPMKVTSNIELYSRLLHIVKQFEKNSKVIKHRIGYETYNKLKDVIDLGKQLDDMEKGLENILIEQKNLKEEKQEFAKKLKKIKAQRDKLMQNAKDVMSSLGEDVLKGEDISDEVIQKNKEVFDNAKQEVDEMIEDLEEQLKENEKAQEKIKDYKKKAKEFNAHAEDMTTIQESKNIMLKDIDNLVANKGEIGRKLARILTAFLASILWQTLVGMSFGLLRKGDSDRDIEETKAKYLLKKFGGQMADEVMGYVPFVRDIYRTITDGYSFNSVADLGALNGLTLDTKGLITDITNGEDFNGAKHMRKFMIHTGQLLGLNVRSVERMYQIPMRWISPDKEFRYRETTGQQAFIKKELEKAKKENNYKMIDELSKGSRKKKKKQPL